MKMRRCEDEKMFYRPPTIGRTLRSDALGKKRRDVALEVNAASWNASSECGVRGGMWRQNVASGGKCGVRGGCGVRERVVRMWRRKGMWCQWDCGVRECGVTAFGKCGRHNVSSASGIKVLQHLRAPLQTPADYRLNVLEHVNIRKHM